MISSKKIAAEINAQHFGNEKLISSILNFSIEESNSNSLMWLSDKRISQFDENLRGTLIISENATIQHSDDLTILMVNNPRKAFKEVLNKFFSKEHKIGIETTARISVKSFIGSDCYIGHNVVIEDDVTIGHNTLINHNTVIYSGTTIGSNCKIGANCSIGGIGFGYEKDEEGNYELLNHIGNVKIFDSVEIGNNTCIDRAVLGSTILNENVKVDNLVHIAHGCNIGKNSLIIANAMIAGSVTIGENVWVAPSASILNQRSVGDNALIGMGAVVLKEVAADDIIVGNPGKSIKKA